MSQNDLSIANQGFASFRSDLNSALQALGSTNSGTSAPSTTYANQLFYDTTNNILKIRNEDNDAFINLITLDQTNDKAQFDLDGTELILDADGDTSITADTDDQIDFKTGGTDRMTIDSSGHVNLSNTLKLKASLDNPILFENQHSVTTDGSISTFDDSSGTMVVVGSNFYIDSSGSETRFNTSEESSGIVLNRNGEINLVTGGTGATASVRVNIDSSGNVLVGRTSTINGGSNSASGAQIGSNGLIQSAVSGDTAISLQRLSDDGDIIQFRKDTTKVGSIGANGSRVFVAGPSKGIKFGNSSADPCTDSGGTADNSYDLGGSSVRWNNLYLSGGVFVGGTGPGNKLDDYEEGTWSPTHTSGAGTGSFSNSNYTKIGKLVHVVTSFQFSSGSGTPGIGNLPFTASSAGVGIGREDQVNGYSVHIRVTSGTTTMELYGTQSTGNPSGYQTTSGTFRCSLTYFTDS